MAFWPFPFKLFHSAASFFPVPFPPTSAFSQFSFFLSIFFVSFCFTFPTLSFNLFLSLSLFLLFFPLSPLLSSFFWSIVHLSTNRMKSVNFTSYLYKHLESKLHCNDFISHMFMSITFILIVWYTFLLFWVQLIVSGIEFVVHFVATLVFCPQLVRCRSIKNRKYVWFWCNCYTRSKAFFSTLIEFRLIIWVH